MLFSPVAVVRLMVGRLSVGICGLGGRNVENCGASNLVCSNVDADLTFLGDVLEKGRLKRGRVNRRFVCAVTSRVSMMRIGSFSDRMVSVVAAGEANGLRARIAGMASVGEGIDD